MKRGKDDDKIRGPMFPRLHVNDTGKGGPRAPPRNKMALYEQLTIPSQRNAGAMPPHHNTNSATAPSTSTMQIQARRHEQNMYFSLHQPPYEQNITSSYDGVQVNHPEAVESNNQLVQVENRKQPLEDDDFMVPIFSQPGTTRCNAITQNSIHEERWNHLGSGRSMGLPDTDDKETGQSNSGDLIPNHQISNQRGSSRVSNAFTRYSSDILMREKDDGSWRKDAQFKMSSVRQDHEGNLTALDATNGVGVSDQPLENPHQEISLRTSHSPGVDRQYKGDDNIDDGLQRVEEYQSIEKENIDKGDDVSETSILDALSGLEITPDDVVRIIGHRHFWKARTAIANQQRVFAVQIFELHRLLKVQKHIAESPDMLLGSTFVGKASLKGSDVKKYSSEYAMKALAHKSLRNDDSHKVTDKVEGTAENAVAKSSPVPPQNAIQPATYRPSSGDTVSSFPPVNMDPKMNPWNFHQPGPHRWLVPVMTPSEGLVYKPYPAPGYVGPVYGGCGPVGPTPMMNPAYEMYTPQYQGMVMPPGMHIGGQGYFPPYGMPMMSPSVSGSTVEQLNQFSGTNPYGQTGQPAGTSVDFGSMQHQSSFNMPSQKNVTIAPAARPRPPKERELQGSTASSPCERTQETGPVPLMEGRDALPLFPAAPTTKISEASPTEKPTRVIRVVPHKPGSTRESAARIFQSIQDERRQCEYN